MSWSFPRSVTQIILGCLADSQRQWIRNESGPDAIETTLCTRSRPPRCSDMAGVAVAARWLEYERGREHPPQVSGLHVVPAVLAVRDGPSLETVKEAERTESSTWVFDDPELRPQCSDDPYGSEPQPSALGCAVRLRLPGVSPVATHRHRSE